MSLLAKMKRDKDVKEDMSDTVGGGNGIQETDVYNATIKICYVYSASSGAIGMTTHFELENGQEYKETFWIQSGAAKGYKNYYIDKKDGSKKDLPGFSQANVLCLLTLGKELAEVNTEERVIKKYNFTEKKDMNESVEMLVDLLDEPVQIALMNREVHKQLKNDAGVYVNTKETRHVNEIVKFLRAEDGLTALEIREEATEADYRKLWLEKWKGKTRSLAVSTQAVDTSKHANASNTTDPQEGVPSAPKSSAKKLFKKGA